MLKDRLRELREENHFTQQDIAGMLKVSVPSVCRWETGVSSPRLPKLQRLAEIYHVDMNYFFADGGVNGSSSEDDIDWDKFWNS